MEEAIRALNQLQSEGLISDWAVGGGMATIFYTEPFVTYDVDIFAVFPRIQSGLIDIGAVYARLQQLGGKPEGQYIVIGKTPLQLLAPPSPLEEEALRMAITKDYAEMKVRVFRPEHLIAIYLTLHRPKDFLRIQLLVEQAEIDSPLLAEILGRYGLEEKWNRFPRSNS